MPRDLRYPLLFALSSAIAPRPVAPIDLRPGPVTVAGLLSSATGLGESARLCHAALDRLGVPLNALDLSATIGRIDLAPPALPGGAPAPDESGLLVVHLNAPHLPIGLALIGRARVRHKRIVGYWAWELEVLPRSWRRGLRCVHEVWVPSAFVATAMRRASDLPVRVVPHPVATPPRSGLGRADFGLPTDAFVVLAMLDVASGYARKNPVGAVRAFRKAFGDDPSALLVLKVGGAGDHPWAERQLCAEIGGAPNIRLVHDKLAREDHGALLDCVDAVVSLHRSEGFGLVLAEAMRLAKPVVATAWSGNMQFMSAKNAALVDHRLVPVDDPQGIYRIPGARWAEPDVDHAARWLVDLARDPELRRRLGVAARADAARRFSDAAYHAAIADALGEATPQRA